MKKLIPTTLLGIVGLTAAGLLGLQNVGTAQAGDASRDSDDQAFVKRDEDTPAVTLVADDDDDAGDDTNTGFSRSTRDGTASNFTRVSRDRDYSRSDKTRDWTYDGIGPKKRDWSANRTNDRTHNDTRG